MNYENTENTETTPVDSILNDIKSALSKCTAEQLTEVERACNTINDLSTVPLDERVSVLCFKSLFSPAHTYKVIDALSALHVYPDQTTVAPGDSVFTAYPEAEALLLRKCTLDQIAEIEDRMGLPTPTPGANQPDRAAAILARCRERIFNLVILLNRFRAFGYSPDDSGLAPCDNPVRDFENAACKASPEQIHAVMRDCGIEYNPSNPAATDPPIEALVKEISRVVTRSDAAFTTACGALAKQGLRPTFRETRPVAEPYTHEDDLGLALAKLNDAQLAEIERRIGIESETDDRAGRVLDAVNTHQYNFFVTVERISAYGIEPGVVRDEPALRGRAVVRVIVEVAPRERDAHHPRLTFTSRALP